MSVPAIYSALAWVGVDPVVLYW